MRLKTELWVQALIRRAQSGGAFACVLRRGEAEGGDVLVKVFQFGQGARIYASAPGLNGERVWIEPLGEASARPETEADAYWRRRAETDVDLWVVEIEDRAGRSFLEAAP
ncbi:MAG: DUF1491 family protein [Maricaulaceae bacterium]